LISISIKKAIKISSKQTLKGINNIYFNKNSFNKLYRFIKKIKTPAPIKIFKDF